VTIMYIAPLSTRNADISFVMSVCPNGTSGPPLNGFTGNLIFEYFWKAGREYSGSMKSDKNNGYLT